MVSLAVIGKKDLIKYFSKFIIMILTVFFTTKVVSNIYKEKQVGDTGLDFKKCLEMTIPAITEVSKAQIDNEQPEDTFKENMIKKVLSVEFAMLGAVDKENKQEVGSKKENGNEEVVASSENGVTELKDETNENKNAEAVNEDLQLAQVGLATEVLPSAVTPKVTNNIKGVQIKNETDIPLTEDMFSGEININKENIIIFHTHTCESYTQSEKYKYENSGTYRTTDLNYTVARVGTELTNYLKKYGYGVIHDTTYHDYPAYTGSYNRSLATVQNIVTNNTQMVLDIHRDAVGSLSTYAPTVKIGEECAAQLMFVMGTNKGGAEHEKWQENLKFAIAIQKKANELYPGLFKPIILRKSRYNQHVSTEAAIIEVGATGNTMEQCLTSMKYLSKIIDEL